MKCSLNPKKWMYMICSLSNNLLLFISKSNPKLPNLRKLIEKYPRTSLKINEEYGSVGRIKKGRREQGVRNKNKGNVKGR